MCSFRHEKTFAIGGWNFGAALDVLNWTVGVYYENATHGVSLHFGPLLLW